MLGIYRLLFAALLCCILLLIAGMYFPPTHQLTKVLLKLIGGHQLAHFYVGALLPLSLAFILLIYRWPLYWQAIFWLSVLTMFAADEYAQSFSALRNHDVDDFLVSALGWSCGFLIWCVWLLFYRYLRRQQLKAYLP